MPYRPLGPCSVRGCPGRAVRRGRCETHAAEAEARYRAEHPDDRPSAALRGYGDRWRKIRASFLKRHRWCVVCQARGQRVEATDVDHIVARRAGGTDDENNLMALCHRHHSQKTAMNDGGFGNKRRENLENSVS